MCDNKDKKSTTDIMALVIICVATLLLLLSLGFLVFKYTVLTPNPQLVYVAQVPYDSVANDTTIQRIDLDSMSIQIESTLQELDNHYKYVDQAREKDDMFRMICSLIVGIAVSIFSFFGYKSMKDIKDKGIEIAKSTSTEESRNTAEKYLNDKLPGIVNEAVDKKCNEGCTESIKNSVLRDVTDKMIELFNGIRNINDDNVENSNADIGDESDILDENDMF